MALEWEEEAQREQILLRAALVGPNGSGKTRGALQIATGICGPEGRIAVLDTEKKRAKLEAHRFKFAHAPVHTHTPEAMLAAAREAADKVGLTGVVILDSMSHEWLQVLTEADKFGDWKDLTPRHKDFVEGLTSLPCHLIVTMRAKVKYSVTEEEVPGRTKKRQIIERLGVGPVQRSEVEYEFDILAYLDKDKVADFANRCEELVNGPPREINEETVAIIKNWLEEGEVPVQPTRVVNLQNVPVPRSWAAIKEAAEAYSTETWADFREFLGQAREHLWPGVAEEDLTKGQKDVLFQKAAGVMTKLLESHDPGTLPPPARLEFQAHWSTLLEGAALEGPEWSMDPDEAAAGRPARVPGGQPPPQGSGEEPGEVASPAASEPEATAPPDESAPPSLEQTVTDAPLTDHEQELLDSVQKGFPGVTEVETTAADQAALDSAPTVEIEPERT
jgi:hypothetical protein